MLLLRPEELGFLRYLKQAKVPLNEFEFSWSKIADIQPQVRRKIFTVMSFLLISLTNFLLFIQLEKLVSKNYFLHMSAKEAYKAYIRAYDSHHLKTIFDVHTLDLARVAQSFGFKVPPTVDLSMFNLICWP